MNNDFLRFDDYQRINEQYESDLDKIIDICIIENILECIDDEFSLDERKNNNFRTSFFSNFFDKLGNIKDTLLDTKDALVSAIKLPFNIIKKIKNDIKKKIKVSKKDVRDFKGNYQRIKSDMRENIEEIKQEYKMDLNDPNKRDYIRYEMSNAYKDIVPKQYEDEIDDMVDDTIQEIDGIRIFKRNS